LASQTESKSNVGSGFDLDLIKALSHPLRFQALHIFNTRVASPTEISQELMVPVNKLAYHVRILEKYDCVELVDTKQRRGATEHFYRATKRAEFSDEEWVQMPENLRGEVGAKILSVIGREISKAADAGTLNARPDVQLIWLNLQLDERGWDEAVAIIGEAEEKLTAVETESMNRLAESKDESVQMGVSLLGFEMPAATSD
jgi:hypothetical protein